MLERFFCSLLLAASLLNAAPKKPKLVVAIVVDQFRYDYLTRFRPDYKGGLNQLLTQGAVFVSANYNQFPTVTAIGHSTFLSGATPAISGIVGNDWYDREEGKQVTSVSDPTTKLVGGRGSAGSSPHRLLVDTIGDELKIADGGQSRVIGISLKDRSAILPAGHMANGAYWFDNATGNFVSSTFYFADAPGWVKDFNQGRLADKFAGAKWLTHQMPADPRQLYPAMAASPFGNEIEEEFAERALRAEQLGKREVTDLLAISFSSNDYVGHEVGPDAPEVKEMSLRTDQMLGRLFQAVDREVGLANTLIVLTADHGVAPVPEVNQGRKMPGGRIPVGTVTGAVQEALTKAYGEGKWVVSSGEHSLVFNPALIAQKKLDPQEVNRTAAQVVQAIPHVFRVYTREQLAKAEVPVTDPIARKVLNGFYFQRAADLEILLEPYWIFTPNGATHGTAFDYDTHVPLIFLGPGIRAARYYEPVTVNDVAPTLAAILEIETPAGSVGSVLTQLFHE
jgi:hypothetical protein